MSYQISIEENMRRILTTQKYTLPLNPFFGLSDKYIDKKLSNELILELKDEILEQIELYEPRLSPSDITIEINNDNLTIHIQNIAQNLAIELS